MIWYVEDDASIRDIAIYALNSAGFETRGFEDGLSFWEALKREKLSLSKFDKKSLTINVVCGRVRAERKWNTWR